MTGVFQISQKIFGQVMAVSGKSEVYANVNQLSVEAKTFADIAEEELRLGIEAIMLGSQHKKKQLNLIAEWHFRRARTKANLAREKFLAAKDFNVSRRRNNYCRLKIQKMDELDVRCEELLRKLSRKNRSEISNGGLVK